MWLKTKICSVSVLGMLGVFLFLSISLLLNCFDAKAYTDQYGNEHYGVDDGLASQLNTSNVLHNIDTSQYQGSDTPNINGNAIKDGDLYYVTYDNPKKHTTYYRTIGWSLSRLHDTGKAAKDGNFPEIRNCPPDDVWDKNGGKNIQPEQCGEAYASGDTAGRTVAWMLYNSNESQQGEGCEAISGFMDTQSGVTACVWKFDEDTIVSKLSEADGDWSDAFQKQKAKKDKPKNAGKTFYFYLGADACVSCYVNGDPKGHVLQSNEQVFENEIPPNTTGYVYDFDDYQSGRTFGVGYSTLSSFDAAVKNRFGIICEYKWSGKGKKKDPPEEESSTASYTIIRTDEDSNVEESDMSSDSGDDGDGDDGGDDGGGGGDSGGSSGGGSASAEKCKGKPATFTYNLSDLGGDYDYYDISTAIPVDESFTNGTEDAAWYGHVTHSFTQGEYKESFNVTVEADWEVKDEETGEVIDKGTESDNKDFEHGYKYNFFWQNDANMWQLQSAQGKNGAFGTATYTGEPNAVSASVDGEGGGNPTDVKEAGITVKVPFAVSVDEAGYVADAKMAKGALARSMSSIEEISKYHVKFDEANWEDSTVKVGKEDKENADKKKKEGKDEDKSEDDETEDESKEDWEEDDDKKKDSVVGNGEKTPFESQEEAAAAVKEFLELVGQERIEENQDTIYKNTHNDICTINDQTYISDDDSYILINGKRMQRGKFVKSSGGKYPSYGNSSEGKKTEYYITEEELEKYSKMNDVLLVNREDDIEGWLVSDELEEASGGLVDKTTEMVDKYNDMFGDNNAQYPYRCGAEVDVHIPVERLNGQYYSQTRATYVPFMREMDESMVNWSISDGYNGYGGEDGDNRAILPDEIDSDRDHMWAPDGDYSNGTGSDAGGKSYPDNEPVIVHSPVIAPISFDDSSGHTQLVKQWGSPDKNSGLYLPQLILDQWYTMYWDWVDYFESAIGTPDPRQPGKTMGEEYNVGYNNPQGFTEHVVKKEIRFPFEVKVNGVYYKLCCDEDGYPASGDDACYTPWMTVWEKDGGGDPEKFEFYLPSWSREGVYGAGASYSYDARTDDLIESKSSYDYIGHQIEARAYADNYDAGVAGLMEEADPANAVSQDRYNHKGDSANGFQDIIGEGQSSFSNKLGGYQYYVAKYSVPCEVSGQIYGLSVNAVNDERSFTDNYSGRDTGVYNFVTESALGKYPSRYPSSRADNRYVAEKRNNLFNRLSFFTAKDLKATTQKLSERSSVTGYSDTSYNSLINTARYMIDGLVTRNWPLVDTLALMEGKSAAHEGMGYLVPGSTFSFKIKTLANLSDPDDYLDIKPYYRFVQKDGTVIPSEDLVIYYDDNGKKFVKMGSEDDIAQMQDNAFRLGEEYFNDHFFAYHKNSDGLIPLEYTAEHDGRAENEILNAMISSSCMSRIIIPSKLRLVTGNEEELIEGLNFDTNDVRRYHLGSVDGDGVGGYDPEVAGDGSGSMGSLARDQLDLFNESMQTWYGKYHIPTNLHICKKTHGGTSDQLLDYLENHDDIREDEDFWLDEGYLILGFDITAYQDDKRYGGSGTQNPHLKYNSRMFAAENPSQRNGFNPGDNGDPTVNPNNPEPTNPGDVAKIKVDITMQDRYSTDTPLYIE